MNEPLEQSNSDMSYIPEIGYYDGRESPPDRHTQATFMALVDAMIPQSPELAEEYGRIQFYGAIDLYIDEYMIMSLNNAAVPLAAPAAELLDVAAEELIAAGGNQGSLDFSRYPGGGTFSALTAEDRFRAITLLMQPNINQELLPVPFRNNVALEQSTVGTIIRLVFMGYYSEWSGYGSTRLSPPGERVLEEFPVSWKQVGYPGPSLGYRVLF